MWFTISMLHFLDQLVQTQRRVSYDRLAETMLRTYERIGIEASISFDGLRKKLSDAVREFGCMQSRLSDMAALDVKDWPTGPLASCAACYQPPTENGQRLTLSLRPDLAMTSILEIRHGLV